MPTNTTPRVAYQPKFTQKEIQAIKREQTKEWLRQLNKWHRWNPFGKCVIPECNHTSKDCPHNHPEHNSRNDEDSQ